jgi:hypothetical protein
VGEREFCDEDSVCLVGAGRWARVGVARGRR